MLRLAAGAIIPFEYSMVTASDIAILASDHLPRSSSETADMLPEEALPSTRKYGIAFRPAFSRSA